MPIFKEKKSVLYAAMDSINQELDRLEQNGVISEVQYIAAPLVYINKKKKQLYTCLCGFLDRFEWMSENFWISVIQCQIYFCKAKQN